MPEIVPLQNGNVLYFRACKEHLKYEGSRYVVVSCKKCIARIATPEDLASLETEIHRERVGRRQAAS